MGPFGTTAGAVAGDPAVGLLPSLVIAAVGLAMLVYIVVTIAREPTGDSSEANETDTESDSGEGDEAEQSGADVV